MRSSGIPRRRGLLGITRIIRSRATATVVERPLTTTGSLGEQQTTTEEHTEDMWLFEPREAISQELMGEQLNGSLGALLVADGVDLTQNDRVVHGGVEYEVDTVVGHPNDGDADGTATDGTDFWLATFTRRQS